MIFLPVFRNAPVKFTEFCGNRLVSLGPAHAICAGPRRFSDRSSHLWRVLLATHLERDHDSHLNEPRTQGGNCRPARALTDHAVQQEPRRFSRGTAFETTAIPFFHGPPVSVPTFERRPELIVFVRLSNGQAWSRYAARVTRSAGPENGMLGEK
jgi:hypothetical protein